MSKIEINNVYKIFGNNPNSVLPMVKDGATKEKVLEIFKHMGATRVDRYELPKLRALNFRKGAK